MCQGWPRSGGGRDRPGLTLIYQSCDAGGVIGTPKFNFKFHWFTAILNIAPVSAAGDLTPVTCFGKER